MYIYSIMCIIIIDICIIKFLKYYFHPLTKKIKYIINI